MTTTATEPYTTQRRFPRVPLAIPVEIWSGARNFEGETENISAGGILLRCQQTFKHGAQMKILFNVPAGFSIHTSCAVVHTLPESRMGLQFLDLSDGSRAELSEFIIKLQAYARRGSRIAKRLTVTLRSLKSDDCQEELAETIMLSRYGGLLVCRSNFCEGEEAFLRWPKGKRGANARIVYRRPGGPSGLLELGFEFKDHPENFWDLEFPPDC